MELQIRQMHHLEAVLGPFASLGVSFLDNQDRFSLACGNLLKHNHCKYSTTGCMSCGVVILQLLHLLECVHALGEDVIPHDAHDYWHLEMCKCNANENLDLKKSFTVESTRARGPCLSSPAYNTTG